MNAIASQITGVSVVRTTVCSGADQRQHQSSAPLAFVRGIHRWPVDSPHKGPVTRRISNFMTRSWFSWAFSNVASHTHYFKSSVQYMYYCINTFLVKLLNTLLYQRGTKHGVLPKGVNQTFVLRVWQHSLGCRFFSKPEHLQPQCWVGPGMQQCILQLPWLQKLQKEKQGQTCTPVSDLTESYISAVYGQFIHPSLIPY